MTKLRRLLRAGRDTLLDAAVALGSRPLRSSLAVLSIAIGVAIVVSVVGLMRTGSSSIIAGIEQFDSELLRVSIIQGNESDVLPPQAISRVKAETGVAAAATLTSGDSVLVWRSSVGKDAGEPGLAVPLYAASGSLLDVDPESRLTGRFLGDGDAQMGTPVAVIGDRLAADLGLDLADCPLLMVNDEELAVVGIVTPGAELAGLANAVMVSDLVARESFGVLGPREALVRADQGAVEAVVLRLPYLVLPNVPDAVEVLLPPTTGVIVNGVRQGLGQLLLAVGGMALVVAVMVVGTATLLSVLERQSEIGLRRAFGVGKAGVAFQFVAESSTIGLVGGVFGTSMAVWAVVLLSVRNGWEPSMDPRISIGAPIAGLIIGAIGGVYPALRAASVDPISALKS